MPIVKHFTQAQWDAAARRLDALPNKPAHEQRVTVRDAVKAMQAQIRGAQKKGYTLDEIVQQLAQAGVSISASTLRYAMQRTSKESMSEHVVRKTAPARAVASPCATKPNPTKPSHARNAGKGDRHDAGKAVTNPGAMVMQDAFSFEIAPDTDNL